jgi:hypothetical protein
MSLQRSDRKRKIRQHCRSIVAHNSLSNRALGDCRRALRVEPLEERRLLTLFAVVAPPTGFEDGANPGNPQPGDSVVWPTSGQFVQHYGGSVSGLTFGANAFTSIQAAINATGGGGEVDVAPGTYAEQLTISRPLTLVGAYSGVTTTIDGGGSDGLTVNASGLVTVQGFTVTGCDNAFVLGDDTTAVLIDDVIANNQGSGISGPSDASLHNVTLNVNHCTISDNGSGINISGFSDFAVAASIISGNQQSGIAAAHGLSHPLISDSTITDNGGYGIALADSDYSVSDCTIAGNGLNGIYDSQAALTVAGSTIADNGQAGVSSGGGIFSLSGAVTVTRTTIAGNQANDGGGIFSASGSLSVVDSTIANNSATTSGGGILVQNAPLSLIDSTVAGNSAKFGGGVWATKANAAIGNTIVAGNMVSGSGASDPDIFLGGTSTASDHDLIGIIGDASGFTDGNGAPINGNLVGTATSPLDPLLSPLANYGGSTRTMTPLPGSPALGAGDAAPASFALPGTDQRGLRRTAGSAVDIGATQSQVGRQVDLVTDPGDGAGATLRNVIAAANPGDIIELALPSGATQIALTQGEIELKKNLTILGPGASSLTIKQTTFQVGPVFRIDATDVNSGQVNVSLSGMTFTANQNSIRGESNGDAAVDNAGNISLDDIVFTENVFGAFYNTGTAQLTNCWLSNGGSPIVNNGTLSISDSSISENRGIAVDSGGQATVTACRIFDNVNGYEHAGGVYNTGAMTIVGSTISRNRSGDSQGGGGISNYGKLTIDGSTVSNNTTDNAGGGIYNGFGNLTVTNSTISNNSADGSGGGIENNAGRLAITNCTIAGNVANNQLFGGQPGNGGGIDSEYGLLTMVNSTITGNTASGNGGGIENQEDQATVSNSTVAGNSAGGSGGGIVGVQNDGSSSCYLLNTIVAGNSAGQADPDVTDDFTYFGDSQYPSNHNLIGIVGDAIGFTTTGPYASLIGTGNSPVDPKLGSLADNGGPSDTMALLPGSPAIDAGDNSPPPGPDGPIASTPATDQRGLPRILNGTVDLGAYEFSRVAASTSGNYTLELAPGIAPDQMQREIIDPGNNVVFTSPVNVTPSLIFSNTGGSTVNLTVDYSAGDPLPASGLTFDGGGNDSLTVTGYNTSTLTDTYTGARSGRVQVGTGGQITYTGLSPLALDGTENDLVVSLPSGAVSATLQDDGTPGNNRSQLVSPSGAFEATTFSDPVGSLSVNAGAGGDTIAVARSFTTDFNANLSLIGGAGDDTFNVYATPVSGTMDVAGGGSTAGNVLNDFTPSDAEIWSDAGKPPVVTLGSSGEQPINYASVQQVNVTAGNGVLNVYGDDNQAATSQNDGYQVVGTGPNAFTLAISGNNAGATSYSQPINFSGVRTLNVNGEAKGATDAHSDANQLTITPYADNTPQGWGVQTFWNQGNAGGNGTLIYNAVPGVSENIVVTPSGTGAGQLGSTNNASSTPVAVVNYSLNTKIIVNGNDGSAGDSDTLTLKGGNPSASGSGQFTADFATLGSTGSSLRVSDATNGKTLYTLESTTNLNSLAVVGAGAPSQNTLLVDGYDPTTSQSGTLDSGLTASEDRTSTTSGVVSVLQSQTSPSASPYPEINYSGVGTLNVNAAAGSSVQGPTIAFGSPGVANSGLQGASDTDVAGQPATLADRITADSTPTFYGTAQADSLVRLYVDMNGNSKVDSSDVFIGETTTAPAAGESNSQWTINSTVNLDDPRFGFPHDGPRTILAVAEDGAGDLSSPQSLTILLDTQGPRVGGVSAAGNPNYNLFLKGDQPIPTPLVNSLNVTFTDPVTRIGGFNFPAVNPTLATTTANYQLVGRTNGTVAITSVTFVDNTASGTLGMSVATLHFATPLADDDYTLTMSDSILDNAGNALDGEFNGSSFPSGNGSPGGAFTASFVVNSRPHLAVAKGGSVSLDISGDGAFNPSNTVPDSDLVETFGNPNDRIFSGRFASSTGAVSGFDEIGAYGFVNNQWRWLLNLNPAQGTSNPKAFVEPLSIDGQPVAGNFAGNRALGMQVGLFNNGTWWLDVLNHHTIDSADVSAGGKLKGNMTGAPIVGDFDGDGKVDLATYQNGVFEFDLSSKDAGGKLTGKQNATINAQTFIPNLAFSGVTASPVAADLDGDGITDLGLVLTQATSGKGPGDGAAVSGVADWFWLVSNDGQDAGGVNTNGAFASLNHAFNPTPLGHDLSYQYGDSSGTPVAGIWDPPTSAAGTSGNAPSGGWIDSLYEDVLSRQPSAADLTNWNTALGSGQIQSSQVAQTFLDSSERLGSIINGFYEQYLGRAADQAGLNYWIGVWRTNGGPEQVQAGIIGSPEYYATAGKLYPHLAADAAWVTALYNNLLGRNPDAQGLDYWVNYIQSSTKQSVVLGFVTSAEYRLSLIDGWFEEYLGRSIDAAGAQYWLSQMEQGATQDQLQIALLTSDEFVNRSQAGS